MTRTSAIFGVVSVLTAAIIGGVFIRQKIISDALYWKAWAEAQIRWQKEIRGLEGDINVLTSDLKTQSKNKEDTSKKIERYEKDIEEAVKDISKHEEQMENFKNFSITKTMFEKITNNLNKQQSLKDKIGEFTSEMDELILTDEDISSDNNFGTKLKNFKKILKIQKEKLKKHATRRILWHGKFKEHFIKKKEKIELKKQFEKSLKDSQSSLFSLESLIEKLIKKLDEKTKELSFLKIKGPTVII